MKRVLIIHGWGANQNDHWFWQAKERFEKLGYSVSVPNMPNTDFPQQDEWVKIIDDFKPDTDSVLIGHSLGGTAILRYLEKVDQQVRKSILVAAPSFITQYPEINNFFKDPLNWNKIKQNCSEFVLLYGTNDSVLDIEHGKELSERLGIKIRLLESNDHLCTLDLNILESLIKK